MKEQVTTFSDDAIAILNLMVADPDATCSYKHLAGGFYWSDEFPPTSSSDWDIVGHDCLYRFLIRIRCCITLSDDSVTTVPLCQQVVTDAPNWPGLLPDRRSGRIVKHLLAAERLADRCLAQLETECDGDS